MKKAVDGKLEQLAFSCSLSPITSCMTLDSVSEFSPSSCVKYTRTLEDLCYLSNTTATSVLILALDYSSNLKEES